MDISNDKIIREFSSGQKSVALVENEKYGICIRKTRNANTPTARLAREINIQNKFDSSYYPHVFFSDVESDNVLIYEEFIEGMDLREIIVENNLYKNNEKACLLLLLDLIEALNLIWEKNIVHRDIKPENIKIRVDGKPVILDLGLAKLLDSTDNLTTTMWLTPGYAPEEQITNKISMIDKRTDFFSLGVVIYELFFGQRLFRDSYEVLNKKIIFEQEEFNNSERFTLILSKLLQKKIYKRYRKSSDIIEDIKIALEGIA